MATRPTPLPVQRALVEWGEALRGWRVLRELKQSEVAARAGVSLSTVRRLEDGGGASLENVLRVARALGVLDLATKAVDPLESDLGRLRSAELTRRRVRDAHETLDN